ncbi:MAG: hypothetical protein JXR94_17555 [Candidatus Hydrogenedentes bacterium]|nr:hypothetical protein [Candidatus Hydrogenedentota bacterium]
MNTGARRAIVLAGASAALCVLVVSALLWAWRAAEFRLNTNLKTLAMGYRFYAVEHDGVLPELDAEPGVLSGNADTLYPRYVFDTGLLFSPPHAEDGAMAREQASARDAFRGSSYVYLGRPVASDDEVLEWSREYLDFVAAAGEHRLRHKPWRLKEGEVYKVPLLIELPRPYPGTWGLSVLGRYLPLSSPEMGGCVAYADGHVEFIRYPGEWPMTAVTIDALRRAKAIGMKDAAHANP